MKFKAKFNNNDLPHPTWVTEGVQNFFDWPQIRMKQTEVTLKPASNPHKTVRDLPNFGPQIRKIAATKCQKLPGSSPRTRLSFFSSNLAEASGLCSVKNF
jgi:hypothetical protein